MALVNARDELSESAERGERPCGFVVAQTDNASRLPVVKNGDLQDITFGQGLRHVGPDAHQIHAELKIATVKT
jgi:hypothetical protein